MKAKVDMVAASFDRAAKPGRAALSRETNVDFASDNGASSFRRSALLEDASSRKSLKRGRVWASLGKHAQLCRHHIETVAFPNIPRATARLFESNVAHRNKGSASSISTFANTLAALAL